jgi:hypothetical protein
VRTVAQAAPTVVAPGAQDVGLVWHESLHGGTSLRLGGDDRANVVPCARVRAPPYRVSSLCPLGASHTDERHAIMTPDRYARAMVPIPDRPAPGLTTCDAKDPDTVSHRSSPWFHRPGHRTCWSCCLTTWGSGRRARSAGRATLPPTNAGAPTSVERLYNKLTLAVIGRLPLGTAASVMVVSD